MPSRAYYRSVAAGWRFAYRTSRALPPLAWIARVRGSIVDVSCGDSVRTSPTAFFAGSWVGEPGLDFVADSTTPFGSGMAARAGGLLIVPPGHTLEGVYRWHGREELVISNSLVGLLTAKNLALLPGSDYVSRFIQLADGLDRSPISLPVATGEVLFDFYENLRVESDLSVTTQPKRREKPFMSYQDYFGRIEAALASVIANAPGYEPIVTISSGYDSTAMAVLAARQGCRRAVTFAHARPPLTSHDTYDSGARTAERLGMTIQTYDRLDYQRLSGLPEAEFLASGYTGEDVFLAPVGPSMRRSVFINGGVGAAMWRVGRRPRNDLWRIDLSGCSMTEFRLRVDFVDVPLPVFGMAQNESLQQITELEEMRPWSVGGYYDRPIPRRIAEEAGIPRGTFATVKRAATALLHSQGGEALSAGTIASATRFAAETGRRLDLQGTGMLPRWQRALVRVAHALHADFLIGPIQRRRRRLIYFPPETGSILFRWGVEQIRPRYVAAAQQVAPQPGSAPARAEPEDLAGSNRRARRAVHRVDHQRRTLVQRLPVDSRVAHGHDNCVGRIEQLVQRDRLVPVPRPRP